MHTFRTLLAPALALALCSPAGAETPRSPKSGPSAHWTAVTQQLGEGGEVFAYMDVDGYFDELGRDLSTAVARAAGDEPKLAAWRQDYAALAAELGLSDLRAMGLATHRLGEGLYSNRLYLHIPGGRRGLLGVLGGEARAFASARSAPVDTDLLVEAELDLAALRDLVSRVGTRFDPAFKLDFTPEAGGDGGAGAETAVSSVEALLKLTSYKGRFSVALRLEPEPAAEPALDAAAESPEPELFRHRVLVCSEGCGGALLDLVRASHPEIVESSREGGLVFYSSRADDPAQPVKAFLVLDGERLLFSNNEAFLRECLARREGLDTNPDFIAALRATSATGNSLVYATPRVFEETRKLVELFDALSPLRNSSSTARINQFLFSSLERVKSPVASVCSNLPDGVLVRSVGPASLRESLPLLGFVNPDLLGNVLRIALPAEVENRRESLAAVGKSEAVKARLDRCFSAAQALFAAEAELSEISHADLLSRSPELADFKPADGEDYSETVFQRQSDHVSVRLESGAQLQHSRALTEAEQALIRGNLELIDDAAAHYFAAHPEESYMSLNEALRAGGRLEQIPSGCVGEDYSISYGRDEESYTITTPGGNAVTLQRKPSLRWTALKERTRRAASIRANLTRLQEAGLRYLAAHEDEPYVTAVELSSAEGEALQIKSVVGEEYADLRIHRNGSTDSLAVPGYGEFRLTRPLAESEAESVRKNLRQIAAALVKQFAARPEETLLVVGECVGEGLPLQELPTAVLGEQYENLVVERGAAELSVRLENGETLSVPLR